LEADLEKVRELVRKALPPTLFAPPVDLVAVEEFAEEVARRLAEYLEVRRPTPRVYGPYKDLYVSRSLDVFRTKLPGELSELLLVSPTAEFEFVFMCDEKLVLRGSFQEFKALSPHIAKVMAIEENGKYVLHISDYKWSENATFTVVVPKPTTFQTVYASIREYVLKPLAA